MSPNNDKHSMSIMPGKQANKGFQFNEVVKISTAAVVLGLQLMSAESVAAAPDSRPPFPNIQLQSKTKGLQAIQALGNHLPEVAAHYRMTPERLSEILQNDKDAWLDRNGRLLFVDEGLAPPPQETTTVASTGTVAVAAPYALSDTFLLHSKPGSQRVIYLDFDGYVATGSAWNAGIINAAPFDLDGVPSSFSTTEQERIQYIWQRVADDYAPFDVDVTTQEPTADALNRTSSTDQQYGMRSVITRNNFGACTGCGGIAYVGVFDSYSSTNPTYYQPAWTFFDALGSGNEKYVAESISHEVGHTLGLSHDGTATATYYAGQGSGATGWAPIMGNSYYQPVTQWSKGEYPGANNFEDQIAVIQSNGALLKSDDFGSSIATAASLGGTASSGVVTVNQSGLIERSTDLDYFNCASGAGLLQITVTPGVRSPNLAASIALLDAAGNVVASANPAGALAAAISVNVPAGVYFLKVDGVGKGDLVTGFSDYDSLGQYQLTGSYAASPYLPPVSVPDGTPLSGYAPLNVSFSSSGSSDPDGTVVSYLWNFGDGTSSTSPNPAHTYVSAGTYAAVLTVTDSQGLTS